ncbi:MAG: HipA family kinase [Calditrichia bacterium]
MLRTLEATEYITPLREGGSLPGVVRAEDGNTYAMKFIGAGQGVKTLIAELIAGEIARVLGFNMPELVLLNLDPKIGASEPDAEIQDLLNFSAGLNLGMAFLEHSLPFSKALFPSFTESFASRLVWFDAFITNVDRTPRNVNMLIHQNDIWLIDHGAALYFQHNWQDHYKQAETPFALVKDHVLISDASEIRYADEECKSLLNRTIFETIVNMIPYAWLETDKMFDSPEAYRNGFVEYLDHRLKHSDVFVREVERVRT